MRRISVRRLTAVLATSVGILGIAGGGQFAGANPPSSTPQSLCEHQHGMYTPFPVGQGYNCTSTKSNGGFNQHELTVAQGVCESDSGTFESTTTFYDCIQSRPAT